EENDEERVEFTVQLQSAVKNFYEMTFEWEELIQQGRPFSLARLDLVRCDRARAFIMVEADPSLTDKLEWVRARSPNVESVRAEQGFGLPPGKDPRDFAECFRAEKPDQWRVVLELKPVEQQAPAPCRVETAKVTSVVREDGSVLHRAVYRVRNRSLQFLGVKLPKGATVWTVHVAGEPKRLHAQSGVSLIPLPKRAEADMGFEVQVIYKTQLEGKLGLLTKITPLAPVLATKDVTVERTFWTIHLPPKFEAAWTGGNMDETAAAVREAQNIKARVQELAKLSSIAESAKSETERQVAYKHVEDNWAEVQRDWKAVAQLNDETLLQTANPQKVQQQLVQSKKELDQLASALGEVQKRQQQIGGKQAQIAQQRSTQALQLELSYGSTKFVAQRAENWRYSANGFKADRAMVFEGLENAPDINGNVQEQAQHGYVRAETLNDLGFDKNNAPQQQQAQQQVQRRVALDEEEKLLRDALDTLSAAKNRTEDEKVEAGRKFENERSRNKYGDKTKGDEGPANAQPVDSDAPDSRRRELLGKDMGGVGGGGGGQAGESRGGRVVNDPAKAPPASRPVRQVPLSDAEKKPEPLGWVANSGEAQRRSKVMEEAEAKKTLLSIGFEFEVPAGSVPLHFTTASNTEDGMQLSMTVLPRTSVERGGRIGKALVVLLLLLSAIKLGLLSGADKKVARALGLVVTASLAGLVFVHGAFAAVAVVVSIVALIKSRRI
ncbi:MAG: hypothetical protein ACAI25_11085, partial [Planctomycetota bacterium]